MRRNWKVVRAHAHAPHLVEACAFGLLAGWIYSFAPLAALVMPIAFSPPSLGLVLLVAALCTFPPRCPHFGMHVLRGSVLGAAAALAMQVALPQQYASEFSGLAGTLSCFAISALLGALCAAILLWAISALVGQPILQDGTRCPRCAYLIVHLPANRCPECGTAFSEADIAPIPPSFAPEWRRAGIRVLLCACLFGGLYLGYPYVFTELLVRSPMPTAPANSDLEWMRYLNCRPKATARTLAACLDRTDPAQRMRAAELIMFLKGPDKLLADELLQHARHDPVLLMRQICLQSFSCIDPERLAESMPGILADPDPMIRWAALASLAAGGSLPCPLGTPWLIRALDDADEGVRGMVYQRLCDNTRQSFPFDFKAPRDQRLRQQATWQEWWDAVAPRTGR